MGLILTYKIDFFALFIFLGVAQGVFFGSVFLFQKSTDSLSNRLLAFLLLTFSAVIGEVFLCYTNLMFEVLWLVDFSEPANFLFAPLCYLYLQSKLSNVPFKSKQYLHFLPFGLYSVYMGIIHFPQSLAYKYNCYIDVYHPALPKLETFVYWEYKEVFFVRSLVNEWMALQLFIYLFLSFRSLLKCFQAQKLSFFSNQIEYLASSRHLFLQYVSILVLFVAVKIGFDRDLGDHILAAHIALVIYIISFQVIRKSLFLHIPSELTGEKTAKKYEKSSLTPETQANTLHKLQVLMDEQKPFLQASFSLPTR